MKNAKMTICLMVATLFMTAGQGFGTIYLENPLVQFDIIGAVTGRITIELYPDKAPVTVENFLQYVQTDFYDGLLFHRVIENFVIQAGAYYLDNMVFYQRQANSPPIINESYNGLSNVRGTIAMARTSEPDSATTQFFINHANNSFLDRANASDGFGYCVFGQVVDGMDVIDAIANTPTIDVSPFNNFPYPPIIINNAKLVPEPATLLLLGIGGLVLRRKKY